MSKFDPDEIGTLMHVNRRSREEHPTLHHIHRHALHRLREIDRALADEPTEDGLPRASTAHVAPQAPLTTGEPGRATTSGVPTAPVMNQESATQPAPETPPSPGTPTEQPQVPQAPTNNEGPLGKPLGADTQPGGVATPPKPETPENPEPPTPGDAPLQRRV